MVEPNRLRLSPLESGRTRAGWARAAQPVLEELRLAAQKSPSAELLALIERAVGHVVKVIMHADDSNGTHLALGRPELADEHELILGTVAHPDYRIDDTIPGREHFRRRHVDPRRWLRVVVDFSDEPAWVVTALVQENPPRGWKP